MDIWSMGTDTEHQSSNEHPTMKDIVNQVLNIDRGVDADEDNESEDGDENLLTPTTSEPIITYKRRWYILIVFALFSAVQGEVSNTWSPIADSAQNLFEWSDHTVALICNLGLITYVLGLPVSTWIMDMKGLRVACLLAALMMTLGTGVWCITTVTPVATWLNYLGQILVGFSGPIANAGAPLVSATWFPTTERTTSTAIALIMNNIGTSMLFILGPLLVPNTTATLSLTRNDSHHQVREDLMQYMYFSCGASGVVFILILLYFPPAPPSPPSISATVQRLNYMNGMKVIASKLNFWLLVLAFSIPNGVMAGLASVIDVNLAGVGISQGTSGWIAFTGVLAASMTALVIGCVEDRFKGHIKIFIISLYSAGVLAFGAFLFIYYKMVASVPLLFATLCLTTAGVLSTGPLFFSMASEVTFPAGEALTNGTLTILFKASAIVFLFVLSIPDVSTEWMNWCFLGSLLLSLPLMVLFKPSYHRSEVETNN